MWPGTSRERPRSDLRSDSQPVTNHASMRPGAFAGINDLPAGVPPTPAVQHHG